jgi:hypothetical protein
VSSLPGIISGGHSFRLRPGNGGTHLTQIETLRSLLVPFSGKTLARAGQSFRSLNEALKAPPSHVTESAINVTGSAVNDGQRVGISRVLHDH